MEDQAMAGGHSPPHSEKCRVFLVEKNPEDAFLDKVRLESCAFVEKVRCFSDGAQLLRYMKSTGFHDRSVMCLIPTLVIVTLDGDMANAFDVLQRLKSDPFLQDIPVLAVMRASNAGAAQRARDLRADDVLDDGPLTEGRIRLHALHAWQWPRPEMWLY
jgi:CheY-like chemotaxis protein